MRFIVIAYDKQGVTVARAAVGAEVFTSLGDKREVLCEGSSFNDVVKSLETAFSEEMNA